MVAACPFPETRGTPIRIFRMAEALGHRGHEVHVVTYHLGRPTPPVPFKIHRISPVKTYRKSSPGPSYQKLMVLDPMLHYALKRVVEEHSVDLIHAHHYEGLLVSGMLPEAGRPPIVYDAHTMLGSELPYYRLGLPRAFQQFVGDQLDRRLPGKADHVITVTDTLRDRLVEIGAVDSGRATAVESGVEAAIFNVEPAPKPKNKKVIVFAGNLAAYQGIDHLLHVFRRVLRRRQDVRLWLLTDSELGRYDQMARDLGVRNHIDVIPVGFDKLPAYLRAADVAVNPRTDCDGMPQKLLNYMAAARPVVSFEGSAAPTRHRITGWIVPDANVAAMAKGVLHLLDNQDMARRIGVRAQEQIQREFCWSRTALRVENVYEQVLSSSVRAQHPVRIS